MTSKALLEHGYYGCDSGCCGMTLTMPDGEMHWTFGHPDSEATDAEVIAWAVEEFAEDAGVTAEQIELGDWECP
jgi:hypothetical protein